MTDASSSLVARAARLLAEGPRHTLEVAGEVLGLSGNASAASSAVFTLLGGDRRFRVDGDGRWSLTAGLPEPGRPPTRADFAVVDVETTGGGWRGGNRVTEVAIVPVSDGTIGEAFTSLVNPRRPIPPRVQGITGITDRMVAAAPGFEGIAPRVDAALRERVFVAHNVRFDWGFVREELLASLGDAPSPLLLCTIRLGRWLVPGLRSYGLDSLSTHFGIRVHDRHRAFGDALATARLLLQLLEEAESRGVSDLHALHEALGGEVRGTPVAPGGRRG